MANAAAKSRDPAERFEEQPPAAATVEEVRARPKGDKVVVCCKIPMGLELRLFKPVEVRQPVMGGGFQQVTEHHEDTDRGRVRIKGPSHYMHLAPKALIVGGYALTSGIDASFFAEWLDQNKTLEAVKNKLIFAAKTADAAQGMAEDRAEIVSNIHPLIPDKDPRNPKPASKALSEVQTGTID